MLTADQRGNLLLKAAIITINLSYDVNIYLFYKIHKIVWY